MKPTVGRIVHFYTANKSEQSNGRGVGPYAAIVVGICSPTSEDPNQMVNLNVQADHAAMFCAGSVNGLNTPGADVANITEGRYWLWPPREDTSVTVEQHYADASLAPKAETFLDRLDNERNELDERLTKLRALLAGAQPVFISALQWHLLHKQADAMQVYFDILAVRINNINEDAQASTG